MKRKYIVKVENGKTFYMMLYDDGNYITTSINGSNKTLSRTNDKYTAVDTLSVLLNGNVKFIKIEEVIWHQ